ncbi:hypothetical protein ACIQ1D_25140 [Lysinibacillus xylanilyticus]|uniref:hypothetical protein n=1 Tax=Lysinibacillus xylanilyticus TaxID=582475 RepID=UPI00380E5CAD
MLKKYKFSIFLLFLLFCFLLFNITGCASEDTVGQQTARGLMEADENNDIFLLKWAVYKKVRIVEAEEFNAVETKEIGSISKEYRKNNVFEIGMASVLPKGTKLYQSIEEPEYVYANVKGVYTLYKSIPEG